MRVRGRTRTIHSLDRDTLDWDTLFETRPPGWSAGLPGPPVSESASESFATAATAAVSTLQLRSSVATVAEGQHDRWHAGTETLQESDTWGKHILRHDYWASIGITNPATQLGTASWWTVAWSAVFVMFCVHRARTGLQLPGAVLGHPTLTRNSAHAAYSWQAHQDRSSRRRGRYWAYRPADALVEVGDIIVKGREGVTAATAWAAITSATYSGFTSHGDIVVRVEGANARAIGGNLGNSVTRASYPLTADGMVDTTSTTNDANRVAAVLKPEGGAFSGRLTSMVT